MTTVTLWLLISIGSGHFGAGATHTQVVERFATMSECERVRKWMMDGGGSKPRLGCIQAAVVR